MKYTKLYLLIAVAILASGTYFFASYNNKVTQTFPIAVDVATTTPEVDRTIFVLPEEDITTRQQRDIMTFTDTFLGRLRDKDFHAVAKFIHPVKGLHISPYQYLDTGTAPHFANGDTFVAQTASTTPRVWGHAGGTGDPIQLTFSKFFTDWLYEHDYLRAPTVRVFRTYTTISDAYPEARIVLYEYPGFDTKYDGMDWAGLVIGIEEYEGEWYVVVLAHAQWMI